MPDDDINYFAEPIMVELNGAYTYIHIVIWEPKHPRKTIFLIHDMFGSSDDFNPLGPRLAAMGYRAVAIDLPGRGKSAWLDQDQYTGLAYVEVLLSAMRAHWLPDSSVLGQGWGAMIALLMENVAKLKFSNLLLLDLPKRWSIEADESAAIWEQVIVLRAEDEPSFWKEVDERVPRGLKGRSDFMKLAGERARKIDGQLGLSVDPRIVLGLRHNVVATFDLVTPLRKLRTRTYMFQGLRSLAPFQSFRTSNNDSALLTRVRVIRATNISWKSDDIMIPVLGSVHSFDNR